MKTSELTGDLLNYWVACAQGWELEEDMFWRGDNEGHWWDVQGDYFVQTKHWKPSTDWRQGGPLAQKYDLNTSVAYSGFNVKSGHAAWSNDLDLDYGSTLLEAICRAVVRSKYGDEVPDLPLPIQTAAPAR